jgi:hypothetical protein
MPNPTKKRKKMSKDSIGYMATPVIVSILCFICSNIFLTFLGIIQKSDNAKTFGFMTFYNYLFFTLISVPKR